MYVYTSNESVPEVIFEFFCFFPNEALVVVSYHPPPALDFTPPSVDGRSFVIDVG